MKVIKGRTWESLMTCTWINCFDSWPDRLSGLSDEVGVLKVDF